MVPNGHGDQDFKWILGWAKTIASSVVDFLQPLQKYLVNPAKYTLPPQQLNWMATVSHHQWIRATQFVRMVGASQDVEKGEVKIVNGKLVSNVVTEKTFQDLLKNLQDADAAQVSLLDTSLGQMVDRYWTQRSPQVSASVVLAELGSVLKKVVEAKHGHLLCA